MNLDSSKDSVINNYFVVSLAGNTNSINININKEQTKTKDWHLLFKLLIYQLLIYLYITQKYPKI